MGAVTKERQCAKIHEIGEALASVGYLTLGDQAKALGLRRSTTWTIKKSIHKASGLSANLINQMLASPTLPPRVRQKIIEYVEERMTGAYGHNRAQRRRFAARLSVTFGLGEAEEIREIHGKASVG